MRQIKLQTFLYLTDLGSFRAVAKKMNATQAAISQRIAGLESEVGFQLFDRSCKPVRLTPKGMDFFPFAEKILDLSTEMMRTLHGTTKFRGTIRLGVVGTLNHVWVPKFLNHIRHCYPDILIDLIVDTTEILRDYIHSGILDIAFLLGPISENSIHSKPICNYQFAWVANKKFKLSGGYIELKEVAKTPVITYPRGSQPYKLMKDLFKPKEYPLIRINASGSLVTTIKMTVDGLGVSVLPPIAIQQELQNNLLQIFKTDFVLPDLQYFSIYPKQSNHKILDLITDIAREIAAETTSDYITEFSTKIAS